MRMERVYRQMSNKGIEYEGNKEKKVYKTFQTISDDYDKLNDVISFCRHKTWKKDAIKKLNIEAHSNVLDICCGTGDLSILLSGVCNGQIHVVGLDFSENMLLVANKRKKKLGLKNIDFIHGNAMALPFEDNTFDHVTIGFGLRNTPDYRATIREMKRVLKVGGTVACIDTSKPTFPIYKEIYGLYFRYLMPMMGQVLSRHKDEYKWLNQSTEEFLSKNELKDMFLEAGFRSVKVKSYAGGAAALHIGTK